MLVIAEGTVIWDDGHGRSGIRFEMLEPVNPCDFRWLHDQFFMRLNGQNVYAEIQQRSL